MEPNNKIHLAINMPAISIETATEKVEVKVAKRRNVQALAYVLGMTAAAMPPGFLGTAEAMAGKPIKYREEGPLEYDSWLDANYEELDLEAAETGMDRELGYDFDHFADVRYDKYVTEYWRDNPLSEVFRKAEAKRQRQAERNLRNRPIRGSL